MGKSLSTTQHHPPHTLRSPFFFFGGCGLSFMGCNELMLVGFMGCDGLMLVGYGGWVWADFGFWLILDFSYGGQW